MHQSLPVTLVGKPLLNAFFEMDRESLEQHGQPVGLLSTAVLLLSLCLRLDGDEVSVSDRLSRFILSVDEETQSRLKSIKFLMNGEEKEITPVKFEALRPILAAQNGVEIPDEYANPELVEAELDIASQNAPKLDIKAENLIHGVAAFSGCPEEDIYGWAILKLYDRANSYHRMAEYIICGVGEMQGAKWKGGNPHPSPWYDKQKTSVSLVSLETFAGGDARNAVYGSGQ